MSNELTIPMRLQSLFDVACDEIATSDQLFELEDFVGGDEQARRIYLAYCQLHVDLHFAIRGRRSREVVRESIRAQSKEAPVSPALPFLSTTLHGMIGYFSEGMPLAYLLATVVTGLGLLIGSFIHVSRPEEVARTSAVAEPVLVGRITGMVDCKWNGGSRVSLGQKYELPSGLMEITYDTGAKVILQGPATYEVESANGGYLSVGRLTGKLEVGPGARGQGSEAANHKSEIRNQKSLLSTIHYPLSTPFVIRTPTATVTDLGTEFGVEVSKDGASGVQVFQGLVTVTAGPIEQAGEPRKLRAGQAVRIERSSENGAVEIVNVARGAPSKFVRSLPQVYRRAVLADKPLFYWTFDEPSGPAIEQVRKLWNQALYPRGSVRRCAHSSIGSGLKLGQAADFSRGDGLFATVMALGQGHISGMWAVEFWVQFTGDRSGFTNQYLLRAGDWGANSPAVIYDWDHGPAGERELEIFARYQPKRAGAAHARIDDAKWHHVILIGTGAAKGEGLQLRLDAVLDGVPEICDPVDFVNRGQFDLDHAMFVGGSGSTQYWDHMAGRIDELAIYDFAGMDAKQIESKVVGMAREHIDAARRDGGTMLQPSMDPAVELPPQPHGAKKSNQSENKVKGG